MIPRSQKGFSILTALFIIVIMSSVGAMIANVSSKLVKSTVNQYQRVQAILLAKSYTEYAIMAVTAHDRGTNCINNITGSYADGGGYTILINIAYIGDPADVATCTTNTQVAGSGLNIIVDTYVSYKDLDHPAGNAAPDVTYHRRTLQKI